MGVVVRRYIYIRRFPHNMTCSIPTSLFSFKFFGGLCIIIVIAGKACGASLKKLLCPSSADDSFNRQASTYIITYSALVAARWFMAWYMATRCISRRVSSIYSQCCVKCVSYTFLELSRIPTYHRVGRLYK